MNEGPSQMTTPSPDPDGLLEEMGARLAHIRRDRPALAQVAPERIRLYALRENAWVRMAQERLRLAPEARRLAEAIVKALRQVVGDLWCGFVPSLRLAAEPAEVLRAMRLAATRTPAGWQEVAERADQALVEEWRRPDLDEDGWADADRVDPPPVNPEGVVIEVRTLLETRMGPIHSGRWDENALPLIEGFEAELERAAALLRWVRPHVDGWTAWTWGILMGRLRFIAWHRPGAMRRLHTLLRPTHRPEEPWAWKIPRHELRRRPPVPGVPRRHLALWLRQALDRRMLRNPEIAELLRWNAATVQTLEPADLDPKHTPRLRKRLRDLKALLADLTEKGPAAGAVPEAAADRPVATEPARQEERPLPVPEERRLQAPAAVLARTRGRRLLLVGNRRDPQLEAALGDLLGTRVETVVCDWRRVAAVRQRIRRRTVDLLLLATGFVGHDTTRALAQVCRLAGVPCVNAGRARPAAVLRALKRDLGLAGPG